MITEDKTEGMPIDDLKRFDDIAHKLSEAQHSLSVLKGKGNESWRWRLALARENRMLETQVNDLACFIETGKCFDRK